MLARPRLKEHLTPEVVSDDRAFVIGEDRSVVLDGAAIVALLPYLDGRRAFDEIVAELADRHAVADIFRAQRKLEALHLLADGHPGLPAVELAYWDASGVDPALVADRAGQATVAVVAIGDVDTTAFLDALRGSGLTAQPAGADDPDAQSRAALVIAVADHYLSPALADLNKAMLASGTPWLLCRPSGVRLWLGPAVRPGSTGCWACRPECGDASLITNRDPRVALQPQDIRFSADGGYRTEPPETTFARLSKHISPILGAVSSLTPITESDSGVTHAYAAGHNFALVGDNMAMLRRNLRGQSGGKGRTDIQAKVSGIAEAIERYCGIWRGDEPVRRTSYEQLDGEHRVHIEDVLNYSDAQYAGRTGWNHGGKGRFNVIPQRFRTDFVCDWTTTWSLTNDRPVLVPAGYVWFGHPDISKHFYAVSDGNGNAAGSVREEAILQGLCELIERDSVAIWWYNRLRRPAFDLDSLDDPYVETLRRYYRSLGRELWMIDITADLGVPTFAAISRRTSGPAEDIVLGFGAHIDPHIAAMRALTEMNQFLPTVAQRNPDGSTIYWEDDPLTLDWWQHTRLDEEPWLRPGAGPATTAATHAGLVRETLTDDLRGLLDRVHDAGLDVMVADQSRPDLELCVVKVIVPGLRHFWRRLGPGRLYDVPVRMGWLDAPQREDELNPKSVFF